MDARRRYVQLSENINILVVRLHECNGIFANGRKLDSIDFAHGNER